MRARLVVGLSLLATTVATLGVGGFLLACEDDSTGAAPNTNPTSLPTSPTPTSTPTSTPLDDGGSTDGAGGDGGLDAGPGLAAVRFANMRTVDMAVCLKVKTDAAYPSTPFIAVVAAGSVTGYQGLDENVYEYKYVAAGADCATAPAHLSTNDIFANTFSRRTFVGRDFSIVVSVWTSMPAAGKETILYESDGYAADFVDNADAAPPANLNTSRTELAPGLTGKLVLANATERPFKTQVGQVTVLERAGTFIVCDDLAAPVGGLSVCDATVRAP